MAQAAVQPYPSHNKYKPSLEIVAEGFQRIRHVAACGAEGSFVTASDRKDLCFWKGPNYEKTRVSMLGIEADVNSLCYLQPTSQNPLGYVVVGCSDRSLSIYVAGESKPQQSYCQVAEKEVRGLRASCHEPGLEFLSCDADQAKLWNLTELREKRDDQPSVRYKAGLEVTCCVDSPDGQRVIVGARNSQLLVFERATGKLAMVLMGHEGPLNDLAMLQGCQEFLSCGSNDPSIRRWNFETGKMLQVYRRHNDEASVRCLALAQGGAVVASCGTDRTLRLWRGGKFAQTIAVPVEGEVWCCELLPGTGDLVCGAGDGTLRLFTADPKRYAAKELQNRYDTELIGMVKEKCTKSNNEKEKKPLEELLQPGAVGGQTIIINEGSGKINSYMWCDRNNKWYRIAEVMKTVDEKTSDGRTIFEGRAWDHVLPVAIGKDAPPNARVAFNDGDNLDVVARQFVRRYGLDRERIPEVLQFIQTSIGARSVLDGLSGQELFQQRGESRVVPRNNVITGEQYLPQKQYVKMKAVQLAGIIDRILEFNRECIPTFPIDKLVCQNNSITIEDKAKKKLVVNQIFEVASRWPAHKVYPILDLARLVVLDKETNELMYADPLKLLELLRRFLPPKSDDTATTTTTGGPARMLVLRLLANSFVEECGETFFSHYFETVNSLIRDTEIGGRHVEIAAATYVLNAAVAASATDDPAGQCNAFSLAMRLMKDTRDPEARFRLLVALGTLLAEMMCEQQHENFVATLRMSEDFFGFLAEALSAPEPQKLSKVALEVKNLVYDW